VLGVLVKGYNARRRRTDAPEWMLAERDAAGHGQEIVVTADGIVRALKGLGIPALNKAFKEGWVPQFDLSPTREGQGRFKGYRARFSLPDGVPASMVADKRPVLAHNLHRAEIEVWPTDYGKVPGGRRGFVDLYVADAGVMEQRTPEYPLLHSGLADVFAGVPAGINQRGEGLLIPLVAANIGVGGQPGQGKSNMMRVIFLGAALDPLAELRVHVFAGNGDFDEYAPRLSMYDKGADHGHIERAVEHLRSLYAEIERREHRLADLGAKKLTRQLAEKHPDMRPLIVGFSECHELFSSDAAETDFDEEGNAIRGPKLGETASELAVQVVKRGRKTGIVTLYDTQSSRAKAIPSELVEQLGVNACFFVKSWRNNDGFLGDGSFAAGIRATDLRFNVDRGTCVVTGISEELFEILRTYYVSVDDDRGWDAATDVIARAMRAVDPRTPVNGSRPTVEEKPRDLLADLETVLGAEAVSAAKAAKALVAQYGSAYHRDGKPLTGTQLVEELAGHGVKVSSTGNKYLIEPNTVRNQLAGQSTHAADLAEADDDDAS
jgi:DNA segregation ATPase FtsK/SpoIIIE, S-DNA-T family